MAQLEVAEFDWILSLLAQRIAADQIIQDGAIIRLDNKSILAKGVRRCQLHTRLLQLVLQTKEKSPPGSDSADLIKLLLDIQVSMVDLADVYVERNKPLLSVLANESKLRACLRIVIILLLLEDEKLHKISISLRRRNSYVSIRFEGGKSHSLQLLNKELLILLRELLSEFGGKLDWKSHNNKRQVYLRLNLSTQLNLI